MKNIGSLLLFFGVGSIVLNQIGYEFSLLMWIDNWGETVGWAIRGGMIVIGGVLLFLALTGAAKEDATETAEAAEAE
jgi:hypothetical protein